MNSILFFRVNLVSHTDLWCFGFGPKYLAVLEEIEIKTEVICVMLSSMLSSGATNLKYLQKFCLLRKIFF